MARATDAEDLWSYKEAMAHLAKRSAVYEPAKQTFPDHDVVSRPKDR
jgi:hypothetical protein